MAHQAHNIPWQSLASNLKFVPYNNRYDWRTDLYPKNGPKQGKELTYFTKGFAKAIEEFSLTERAKYPEKYRVLEPDEVLIGPGTEQRIKKTVRKYREADNSPVKSPRLGLKEKTVQYWIWRPEMGSCDCYRPYEDMNTVPDSTELLVTLLLHGEMDTILNLAAQPNTELLGRYDFPCNYHEHGGWIGVEETALMAYICLNVFYLKPESYAVPFRKSKRNQPSGAGEEIDYRRAASYQKMLFRCTGTRIAESSTYPHREFFGVEPEQYDSDVWRKMQLFGITSLEKLRKRNISKPYNFLCSIKYLPTQHDIPLVIDYLRLKGLPTELALYTLQLAEYTPQRRSVVLDDPLHAQNGTELRRYLNYCWKLLVRCDVLAKECGKPINWEYHVQECIMSLWGDTLKMVDVSDDEMRLRMDDIGRIYMWKFV